MNPKTQELRALGDEGLIRQLAEAEQELFNLRFRVVTRQLNNYREIPKVKKKIARLKTILRERELAQTE